MTARVLVTRPEGSWPALAARFAGSPILLEWSPTTVQVEPADPRPCERALAGLERASWLAVTSGKGVEFLVRKLGSRGLPEAVRVAAVGEATARVLRQNGLRVDLVAGDAGWDGLAATLIPRLERGARVVVVRPEGTPSPLASALREAGAEVDEAPLYRTAASDRAAALAGEAIEGRFAGVVFTAPSSLALWLEASGGRRAELSAALARVRRVAIGATTAAYLASAGLPAAEVAVSPSESAIGDAIARVLLPPTC